MTGEVGRGGGTILRWIPPLDWLTVRSTVKIDMMPINVETAGVIDTLKWKGNAEINEVATNNFLKLEIRVRVI